MTKFEAFTQVPLAIVEEYEEPRSKEQHMGDYIKSVKALEDAMEPYTKNDSSIL